MAKTTPVPLYPTHIELCEFTFDDYPTLDKFLETRPSWCKVQWQWGKSFLEYTGRNKSNHTYDRFRNEVEKFILWSYLEKNVAIDQLRKADILEYADFCWKPPVTWIGTSNQERFKLKNSYFTPNEAWYPFKIQATKNHVSKVVDKKKIPTITANINLDIHCYHCFL